MKSTASNPLHVCLLGPPGVGKSPLGTLFRLPGFEPFRIRKPRNEKDRLVCKSEEQAKEIFIGQGFHDGDWPIGSAADNWFRLGARWLFFSVRGDKQCLEFQNGTGNKLLASPKRMEIFAPRLVDILCPKDGSDKALGLSSDNLMIISLNPTATPFATMRETATDELKQAIFYGLTKRTELQEKPVDLPDILKRVRRLDEEIRAWGELKSMAKAYFEFTSWKHLEFRYLQPNRTLCDARRELLATRETLLARLAVEAGSNSAIQAFLDSDAIRSVGEILELSDIV